MKLSEAFVKALRQQGKAAVVGPGLDTIQLPLDGPRHDQRKAGRGLTIQVDLNVLYHVYCSDPATVAACHAIRQHERGTATDQGGPFVDFSSLLEVFGVTWCGENEHLQVQGVQTLPAAAAAAWRMGELAVALQLVAYGIGTWEPFD